MPNAASASATVTTFSTRDQRSGFLRHWNTFTATCVPSGLVKMITSPATAFSGRMIWLSSDTARFA